MKPKERFYNYALFPTSCDQDSSTICKDDSPIDLSTKRTSPKVHSMNNFTSSDIDAHSIATLKYNELSSKYNDLLPNQAQDLPLQTHENLLPYLLLNRTCYNTVPSIDHVALDFKSHNHVALDFKSHKNGLISDHYGNTYSVNGRSLIPIHSSSIIDLCKSTVFEKVSQNGSLLQRSTYNNTNNNNNNSNTTISSPSSSSSPLTTHHSPNDYNETRKLLERSPTNSSFSSTSDNINNNNKHNINNNYNYNNRSHNGLQLNKKVFIKKSKSFPLLPIIGEKKLQQSSLYRFSNNLYKSRSENDLPDLLRKKQTFNNQLMLNIIMNNNNNNNNNNNTNNSGKNKNKSHSKTSVRMEQTEKYVNNRYELQGVYGKNHYKNGIESHNDYSDQEKEDEDIIESGGTSDDYASDDALDLRITNSTPPSYRLGVNYDTIGHPDEAERLFHHINTFLVNSPHKEDLSLTRPSPLDFYRQYYYYLMNQPAIASRAAVAMAETYAKIISTAAHHQARLDFQDNTSSKYENESSSPDFIINGTRTELRSADTTNNGMPFDRKRISRPLTGKHVRHGTGASPSTLLTLRNMIQERQRLREIGVDLNKYGKGKGGKRAKRK